MKLTGQPFQEPTLFAEVTPANHSASPEHETVPTIPDTSGRCSLEPLAWFDRDTHCWRMFQGTLVSDLEALPLIWPRSGMSLNGTVYQRPPSAPLTAATDCSSWPTPRSAMGDSRNSRVWRRPDGLPQNLENRIASEDPETIGQPINPAFLEWLMGFPIGWTDLEG